MSTTIAASTPAAPPDHPSEALPVPSHALHSMPEPEPGTVWSDGVTNTGTFLRVGSVVPISVLSFAPDGTATDVVPQSTADRLTAECRAEIDAILRRLRRLDERAETPEPESPGSCGFRWPAEPAGEYICTGSAGHSRDHKAHNLSTGTVISEHPTDATVAAKPVRRRPSPRPRTTVAS